MKIKKRNGKIEDFDKGKIVTSITNASDEVNEPLNESDIYIVTNSIYHDITNEKDEIISSEYIFQAIYTELKKIGFKDVAESYRNGLNRR
ncbi:MAG: ATPase [Clostridium cadaveris]|uniref:ATPase n=1 Tax=Clostridium cadaveris TaxID=1529 RepID=A0A316LYX6_9CLOT|nr:MAG: ATPase [Clostridium cadaveris]